MIIADSDLLIQVRHGNPSVVKWMNSVLENERLIFPTPIIMELIRGCRNKQEINELDSFIKKHGAVYIPTQSDMAMAMDILREQYLHGDELSVADAIIAACAKTLHVKLYTNDRNIHRVRGIKAEAPYLLP
jgi:predicted nucleic acid-binding protein